VADEQASVREIERGEKPAGDEPRLAQKRPPKSCSRYLLAGASPVARLGDSADWAGRFHSVNDESEPREGRLLATEANGVAGIRRCEPETDMLNLTPCIA